MEIYDAHMHFSKIASFVDAAAIAGVDYSAAGLIAECEACGVARAVGMGVTERLEYAFPDDNALPPMMCDLPNPPPFLKVCAGINPCNLNEETLALLDADLKNKTTAGVKIYAGYYPFTTDDKIYSPVYALAEKYNKPVVIHTGGTYSDRGILEYSRPTHVDKAAVKFPCVNFVMAHLSVPWVLESCEYAYKNKNVYVDLSGLIVGDENEIKRVMNEPLITDMYRQGLVYMNKYERVLYGSDWPLVPMKPYIAFCEMLIPGKERQKVFYDNAASLFD